MKDVAQAKLTRVHRSQEISTRVTPPHGNSKVAEGREVVSVGEHVGLEPEKVTRGHRRILKAERAACAPLAPEDETERLIDEGAVEDAIRIRNDRKFRAAVSETGQRLLHHLFSLLADLHRQ